MMRTSGYIRSIGAIRRKLRALAAVIEDPGATEHERANAEILKRRLEQRLREAGAPTGDWTDFAFRFGKWAKDTSGFSGLASPKRDWTQTAFRLGKTLRRGYKKWLSE